MSGPCSMCQHFSMPDTLDPKLRAGGWGICALGSDIAGHYQSQAAACQFSPSRFLAHDAPEGADAPLSHHEAPRADGDLTLDDLDLPEEIDFG